MTVLLKIAFDGTDFHGFQIQDNHRTVFGEFQKALIKVLGHKTDIKGCSRTDSGVHAKCYYISFSTPRRLNLHSLPLSLNANLPSDIVVLQAKEVPEGFHARYRAKGKQYTYYIKNSHIDDPFTCKYYHKVPGRLDWQAMDKAAAYFVGKQDFRSFMARKSKIVDCVRTVYSAKVEKDGDMVKFIISADGYLYNMVRIMAGTLIDVGRGKTAPEKVADIIAAKSRGAAGATAPACGLFLTDVFYDFD